LPERNVEPGEERDCRGLEVTRGDLAEMAGLTYFTVSRMLSLWQKQGLVKSCRQRMTVLDPDRLAEIAEGRK